MEAIGDAEIEAAIALVDTVPTTSAGAVALLQYVMQHEAQGEAWPVGLVGDDGKERSWHFFLCENLATMLTGAGAQQGA